jgi:hypothetical protein
VRAFLPALNEMIETYKAAVTFVFVYIEEAHAIDEWPMPSINNFIPQHKTLEDRYAAAGILTTSFEVHKDCTLFLDNINNDYNRLLPSWPFRYYVVKNGVFQLKTMPVDGDKVKLDELQFWLETEVEL